VNDFCNQYKHTTKKQLESTFISRSVTSQRPFSTAHWRTVLPGKCIQRDYCRSTVSAFQVSISVAR